jgi:AcrR family transcriptional regulator
MAHPARSTLSPERIAEAALDLVDRDGLAALTMRRLGSELGVEGMSLYFYFSSKEDILDKVVDLLLSSIELPPDKGRSWDEVAHQLFENVRAHLLAHPNTVQLFATRLGQSVEALAPIELSLRNLREAGFDEWGAIDGHRILMSFTLGYVISEVTARTDPNSHPEGWGTAAYALRELPADQLPHLTELAPIALAGRSDRQFDTCLTTLLGGLRERLGETSACD